MEQITHYRFQPISSSLSVKSIATCRCVSKTWASILLRQDFTELFLSRSITLPKLLLAYQKGSELFFSSAPQPRNPDVNSTPVVATYHMKLSFDSYFDSGGEFQINGLDPGLVGLANRWFVKRKKYSAPLICNPSTGQLLHLTRVKTRRDKSRSLFGYDPIDKQVKVLSMLGASYKAPNMVPEEYQIMTLGTGKLSQRMINSGRVIHCNPHVKEICINGVFYYPFVDMST